MSKLNELCDWCDSTGVLYVDVSFYHRERKFALRVTTPWDGKARPMRSLNGDSLESLAAQALESVKALYEPQKAKLKERAEREKKRHKHESRSITRDIEAMHHSAGDF